MSRRSSGRRTPSASCDAAPGRVAEDGVGASGGRAAVPCEGAGERDGGNTNQLQLKGREHSDTVAADPPCGTREAAEIRSASSASSSVTSPPSTLSGVEAAGGVPGGDRDVGGEDRLDDARERRRPRPPGGALGKGAAACVSAPAPSSSRPARAPRPARRRSSRSPLSSSRAAGSSGRSSSSATRRSSAARLPRRSVDRSRSTDDAGLARLVEPEAASPASPRWRSGAAASRSTTARRAKARPRAARGSGETQHRGPGAVGQPARDRQAGVPERRGDALDVVAVRHDDAQSQSCGHPRPLRLVRAASRPAARRPPPRRPRAKRPRRTRAGCSDRRPRSRPGDRGLPESSRRGRNAQSRASAGRSAAGPPERGPARRRDEGVRTLDSSDATSGSCAWLRS